MGVQKASNHAITDQWTDVVSLTGHLIYNTRNQSSDPWKSAEQANANVAAEAVIHKDYRAANCKLGD